jgi:hypothetical protein
MRMRAVSVFKHIAPGDMNSRNDIPPLSFSCQLAQGGLVNHLDAEFIAWYISRLVKIIPINTQLAQDTG